jgi:uncharacterized protein Veg
MITLKEEKQRERMEKQSASIRTEYSLTFMIPKNYSLKKAEKETFKSTNVNFADDFKCNDNRIESKLLMPMQ